MFFIWVGAKRRKRILHKVLSEEMLKRVQSGASSKKRLFRDMLFLLGILCLLVAVARPWWGKKMTPVPERSRSVLIVLDSSKSMLAADTEPSRFKHAKWYVRQIIRKFQGDKFGIISFAGDAFLECPLTTDVNTLLTFLKEIDTSTIPLGGTNIDKALKVAAGAFENADSSHRAIVLISDGGELQGNALQRADSYNDKGIPIITVGVGKADEGTLIKTDDGTYVRDKGGEPVLTRLNDSILKELAMRTDGEYIHSTTADSKVQSCIKRLQKLVPEENEEEKRMKPVERFQIPLGMAVVLLLVRLCIGERQRDAGLQSRLLLLLMLVSFVSEPLISKAQVSETKNGADSSSEQKKQNNPDPLKPKSPSKVKKNSSNLSARNLSDEGKRKLQEKVKQLKDRLENSVEKNPEQLHYNLGVIFQQLGQKSKAREHYKTALRNTDKNTTVHAWSLGGLGRLNYTEGVKSAEKDLDKSIKAFKKAENYYKEALRQLPLLVENWPQKKLKEMTKQIARNYEVTSNLRDSVEIFKKNTEKLRDLWQKARQAVSLALQKQKEILSMDTSALKGDDMDEVISRIENAKERTGNLKQFLQKMADKYESKKFKQQLQQVSKVYQQSEKALIESKQASQKEVESDERDKITKTVKKRLEVIARLLGMKEQGKNNNGGSDKKQGDKQKQEDNKGNKNQKGKGDKSGDKSDNKSEGEDGKKTEEESDESLAKKGIEDMNKKTQQQKTGQAKDKNDEIERQQAIGVLRKMMDQERDFREALKRYRSKKFKSEEIEKDW